MDKILFVANILLYLYPLAADLTEPLWPAQLIGRPITRAKDVKLLTN